MTNWYGFCGVDLASCILIPITKKKYAVEATLDGLHAWPKMTFAEVDKNDH